MPCCGTGLGDGARDMSSRAWERTWPYVKGRCIDLSKAGARALGFAGLAPVNVVPVVSDQPSVNRYPGATSGQLVKDAAR